jgi:probable rRNA maturation factor
VSPKIQKRAKIDIVIADPSWSKSLPKAALLGRRAARLTLRADPESRSKRSARPAELSLCLADDRTVRRLNKDYLGKDKPTNVLSFPSVSVRSAGGPRDRSPTPVIHGRRHLGDIILAFGTVRREARGQEKTLAQHYCHLVVHGVLHLLGFDHKAKADARIMEDWERSVLAELGYEDPYR